MCKCTPELEVEFCGRGDCKHPKILNWKKQLTPAQKLEIIQGIDQIQTKIMFAIDGFTKVVNELTRKLAKMSEEAAEAKVQLDKLDASEKRAKEIEKYL